jgi:hypothetical protein
MKYLFFDLDGTISESKQNATNEMLIQLSRLNETKRVFIVSGAELSRMLIQTPLKYVTFFSQNGNLIYDGDKIIQQNELTNKKEILEHIKMIAEKLDITITDDMIDDRGSQISFSFVGHNAPFEVKKQFDPDRSLRLKTLEKYPFHNALVAGTTCIDYIPKTKGENIQHYLELRKIKLADCLYVGDALDKGCNDYSVVGIIPTFAVKSPADTLKFIKQT